MYLSKPEIAALDNALQIIEQEIKCNEYARDANKRTYFLMVGIKEKTEKYRKDTLAYQKESRFNKTQPPVRFCCVCRYRFPEESMRRLTAYESGVQKMGRADQWICAGSHRTPHNPQHLVKQLGRPSKNKL